MYRKEWKRLFYALFLLGTFSISGISSATELLKDIYWEGLGIMLYKYQNAQLTYLINTSERTDHNGKIVFHS